MAESKTPRKRRTDAERIADDLGGFDAKIRLHEQSAAMFREKRAAYVATVKAEMDALSNALPKD